MTSRHWRLPENPLEFPCGKEGLAAGTVAERGPSTGTSARGAAAAVGPPNAANGDTFRHLAQRHPCFSAEAHTRSGRIHLPVSPTCNIRCRFCERGFDVSSWRPGRARRLLKPTAAPAVVARARKFCPELSVVGVAGPGESLATSHAVKTLKMVLSRFPDLIGCLSTNGLGLSSQVNDLGCIGVRTITVTVNALTPEVWTKVYAWVRHAGRKLEGEEACRVLTAAQEEGIRLAAARGLIIKVNTVLLPGVNEREIGKIAAWAAACGASLMNVIPLQPAGEMAGLPAPDCSMMEIARQQIEEHLPVFRHCRHCRADACGIPGISRDFAADLYGEAGLPTFSHG